MSDLRPPTSRVRFACPVCRGLLRADAEALTCRAGHVFPVVDGIPVLLDPSREGNHARHWSQTRTAVENAPLDAGPGTGDANGPNRSSDIDPYVMESLVETHGRMYRGRADKLVSYPIPEVDLPAGKGSLLLDVGCNWGRWSIAATRKGYSVVGLDPSIEAIRAARRIAAQLGHDITYVVADARCLPFPESEFSRVFSYSVLQHFSKDDLLVSLDEIRRVLEANGVASVEMLSATGSRSLWNQARRAFRAARAFEVRYYTPWRLRRIFEERIGPTAIRVDGFLTANPQVTDLELLPERYRRVVRISESLKAAARVVPGLRFAADSLFLDSCRSPETT